MKGALIAVRSDGGTLEVFDASGGVRTCENPHELWGHLRSLDVQEVDPDLEDLENIGRTIVGELGPITQAVAPLAFRRIGGWLRRLSR